MSARLEVRDAVVRYGRATALDGATFTVPAGSICGLLGRNGAGKTTLLSLAAAFRRPDAGTVTVDGVAPWEDAAVMERVCLVRESGDVLPDASLRDNLSFVALGRPHYSADLAGRLLDTFELDPRTRPSKLSRGKRSAFGVVVGLASRAELTLLDEPHLGMDAPTRHAFYDALLADWVEHPRTIVLSSHLIDEVQRLLDRAVVVHRGRVVVEDDAEALRARGVSVTGPAAAVDAFVAGRTVLGSQQLGRTRQVTVDGGLDDAELARARAEGLDIGPVDLQDLVIHLTAATTEAVR